MRDPTAVELEWGIKQCEKWCKDFPKLFPGRSLTRKMVEISLVLPKFIEKEAKLVNKILRLEQEGEHLHALMNRSENKFKSTKDKSTRYWQMLCDHENKIYNGLK